MTTGNRRGRPLAWAGFASLAVLAVFALAGPHPVTALAVGAAGLALVWLAVEYPRTGTVRRRLHDEIDEDADDWPHPVPLGPPLDEDEEEAPDA